MMKKLTAAILALAIVLSLCSCTAKNGAEEKKPELSGIKNICTLATMKCYYHNVAKSDKAKSEGLIGMLQQNRKFWVEYTGIATLGVDMKNVSAEFGETVITIVLPKAEVLSISIDQDSYSESSIFEDTDGKIFKNKITAEDVTASVQDSLDSMRETAEKDEGMLTLARNRAKTLIGNYISRMGEIAGVEYEIVWKYPDGSEG